MVELHERYKRAIAHANITTKDLAKNQRVKAVISYQGLVKIESNQTKTLTAPVCAVLSRVLGVRSEWLAIGDGPMVAKAESAFELREGEDDLILAIRDIPDADRREICSDIMAMAKKSRDHFEQMMRDRFGVTGTASPERVAQFLEAAPTHAVHEGTPAYFEKQGEKEKPGE